MAFGISIKAAGVTALPLRNLWRQFAKFEPSPSMEALDYPPHLTLAVYDDISEGALRKALHSIFHSHPPLRLNFGKLSFFEQPKLVLYAFPDQSGSLRQTHLALHRMIEPTLCRENYRPGNWVPHCTLATQIGHIHREAATALAGQAIEPFEVVFDAADCVEFYPVRVIEEKFLIERT